MLQKLFQYILPLIPLSGLTMASQALYAWLYPTEEISHNFFLILSDLYVCELLMMHSNLFWNGRLYLINVSSNRKNNTSPTQNKIFSFLFGIFLFIAYGLFILPMYRHNTFLAINYLIFNLLRFFSSNNEVKPWYANTKFYKKWYNESIRPIICIGALILKLFSFALVLPLLATFLPLPNFGLTEEITKNYPSNHNDPYGPIILTKTMFLYFSSVVLYDMFARLYKFKEKTSHV